MKEQIFRERHRIALDLERRLGDVVVDSIQFSQTLARNIENHLRFSELSMAELSYHPDILEIIADDELDLVLFALDKAKVSGVFVVLDTTVNPYIEGADISHSGFFIRNTEPVVPSSSYKLFLRGFADLAYQKNLSMLSNWRLEFTITSDRDFYTAPKASYQENPSLPLARSYYWTFNGLFGEYREEEPTILCSIPIISSQGEFLGVCGFEVSTMNFRAIHNSITDPYPRLLGIFGPHNGKEFEGGQYFLSGSKGDRQFTDFVFLDNVETVKLYPGNSPYTDKMMAVALGMPKQDYNRMLFSHNGILLVILLLLGGGIFILSLLLNRYYRKSYSEQLAKLQGQLVRVPPDFDKFGLSKREKEICTLLLKGYTIKEIGAELFIAFATVNNHCQNIYRKLDINSRQELFLKFGS
ncbi:helix-turn-helix transcriptional regulator [Treponema primitia]|uniref:helix-turn-helix transcriptional regulator n=1 Tax=Treponema primitia TaxID=88058 RepID=UPI001E3BC918|nr:LuxR C-terminal-related transcriptional regulator [Treponema primitia]